MAKLKDYGPADVRYTQGGQQLLQFGGKEYVNQGGRWVELGAGRPDPRTGWPPEHLVGIPRNPLVAVVLGVVLFFVLWGLGALAKAVYDALASA